LTDVGGALIQLSLGPDASDFCQRYSTSSEDAAGGNSTTLSITASIFKAAGLPAAAAVVLLGAIQGD
jgi:hypothetical protein